jgi:hypothetical protein
MPAVRVIKHPALATAVTPCRPAARKPCGLPFRVAPAQQKETPGEAPGVGSALFHSVEEIRQALVRNTPVPLGTNDSSLVRFRGTLALLTKGGRSGIYPRLSEAKGRVSKINASSLRRRPARAAQRSTKLQRIQKCQEICTFQIRQIHLTGDLPVFALAPIVWWGQFFVRSESSKP